MSHILLFWLRASKSCFCGSVISEGRYSRQQQEAVFFDLCLCSVDCERLVTQASPTHSVSVISATVLCFWNASFSICSFACKHDFVSTIQILVSKAYALGSIMFSTMFYELKRFTYVSLKRQHLLATTLFSGWCGDAVQLWDRQQWK